MKKITTVLVIILMAIVVLVATRVFGEDTWICENGAWVKHGNPAKPVPTSICLGA